MKYVSYKALYTMLPRRVRNVSTGQLNNWIIQCLRLIDSYALYEKKIAYATVKNGKASLPKDFIRMQGVYYNHTTPDDTHLQSLLPCLATDESFDCADDSLLDGSQASTGSDSDVSITTQDSFAQRNSLVKLQRSIGQGNTEDFYVLRNFLVGDYLRSTYHTSCWIPLKLTDRIYSGCYLEEDSPCWVSDCPYEYSLTKCNELITTLPNGYISIVYTGRAIDTNGDFLVPDDQQWLQVLKEGVIMMYFEERRLDQKQGAMGNHREYQKNFFEGVAYLRGKQFYPNTAQKDKRLRNIFYGKIAIANNYTETGNAGYTTFGYEGGSSFNHVNL